MSPGAADQPPMPIDARTRWQGTTSGTGLDPHAPPTARAAPGLPGLCDTDDESGGSLSGSDTDDSSEGRLVVLQSEARQSLDDMIASCDLPQRKWGTRTGI